MDKKPIIEFIEMPEDLRGKYQYYTQADITKLRSVGYEKEFSSLTAGAIDYVSNHLAKDYLVW